MNGIIIKKISDKSYVKKYDKEFIEEMLLVLQESDSEYNTKVINGFKILRIMKKSILYFLILVHWISLN